MGVKYSLMQRINPRDPAAAKKFYAIAVTDGEMTLRKLAKQISDISTVSPADTLAVLESLVQVMPDHLLDGKIVRLGEFGSFRLSLSSEGAENAADFNKNLIKRVKLLLRPGKTIRDTLKTVTYEKA